MKDNFSAQSDLYARYRPSYPPELFSYLAALPAAHELAWDCGTGNGQLAEGLSTIFRHVHATDISEKQLALAVQRPAISYHAEPAEHCSLPDASTDLITVAQAVHWFNFDAFYAEVRRVAKPGSWLALIGYNLLRTDAVINEVIGRFYTGIVGPYWDKERRHIDAHYSTIPFPFQEIKAPEFSIKYVWNFDDITGYLHTWSAVQHYRKQRGEDPVELIRPELEKAWGDAASREIIFPVFTRIGQIQMVNSTR